MNFLTYPCRTSLSKLAVAVATATITSVAMANGTINQVSVGQVTTDSTTLNIGFSQGAVKPTAYQMANPNRLVLDFSNVDSQGIPRVQAVNQGQIHNVTTVTSGNTTRMIVELDENAKFTNANVQNGQVVVTTQSLQGKMIQAPAIAPVVATTNMPAPAETMVVKVNPLLNPAVATSRQYSYDGLTAISLNGSANGGASVGINLVNDSIPVDVQRTGDELVIRLTGATIPNHLLKQMAGTGLVGNITANNQGRNGVIRIAMNDDYEYKAYQTGSQLSINIEPPKKLREPTLEERTYTGAPLSLEFQDVSVRQILEVLGQHTNTNIIASDSVSGNITLRLINVPWDQALDIILKSKNLDKRVNGNVIWIAPAAELTKQENDELQAIKDKQELDPVRPEYIRLNYAKAEDVRTMIESDKGGNGGNHSTSLLSSRGTVTIDARTNTLIIKDTNASIANIRDLISKIDIPVKQVMIEARIVNASDSFSKEMGVKWGILGAKKDFIVGGTEQTLWDVQTTNAGEKLNVTRPNNLNVNLGASNPTGSVAFGLLNISDMLLDLELSAMQSDGRGEVVSSPKVLTADKQKAKIMSGTQIPYQEASASGATSTSFKDAVLSLEVTPNITPEGRVGMGLAITNDSANLNTSPPTITTRAIQTNVIVDDGQTVVLGGIFENTTGNNMQKVPFLGDMPGIKSLFRRTSKTNSKTEMLIFVTPKIVNDGVSRMN
nr:type IV pilus secretin PilQ [uncultured Moraxella sp.]